MGSRGGGSGGRRKATPLRRNVKLGSPFGLKKPKMGKKKGNDKTPNHKEPFKSPARRG